VPGQTRSPTALEQGQDTDPDAVAEIRDAVRSGSEASVRLLNYKKSGKPFWNMFTLAPMADVDGNLRFIIGVQVHTNWHIVCGRAADHLLHAACETLSSHI
jgi:hypothetical protein